MDLEKINNEYIKYTSVDATMKIEKMTKEKERLQIEFKKITRKYEDQIIVMNRAKEDGEIDKEKKAKEQIIKIEEQKAKIMDKFTILRSELEQNQINIDKIIEEIKKEPGMQEHINDILGKKFDRKLKKLNIEKENLMNMQLFLKENPDTEKQVIGMVNAKKELDILKYELNIRENNKESFSEDQSFRIGEIKMKLIPELEMKFNNNKVLMIQLIEKRGKNISEDFLESFVSGNFASTPEGKINFTKSIENKIKGNSKQINYYSIAISKIGNTQKRQENQPKTQINNIIDGENLPVKATNEDGIIPRIVSWFRSKFKEIEEKTVVQEDGSLSKPTGFIEKAFSWLKSRFKDDKEESKEENISGKETINGTFKNSLKYEVVQKIADEYEKELLEETKLEIKNNKQNKNVDIDGR